MDVHQAAGKPNGYRHGDENDHYKTESQNSVPKRKRAKTFSLFYVKFQY